MFKINSTQNEKETFLKQAEEARQKRILEKKKQTSAIKIQSTYRGYATRKRKYNELLNELNESFLLVSTVASNGTTNAITNNKLPSLTFNLNSILNESIDVHSKQQHELRFSPTQIYTFLKKYFFLERLKSKYKNSATTTTTTTHATPSSSTSTAATANNTQHLFGSIIKYILISILKGDLKTSYVSLIVSKSNYKNYLIQSTQLVEICFNKLNQLNLKDKENLQIFEIYLNFLLILTNEKYWKCFNSINNIDTTSRGSSTTPTPTATGNQSLMNTILKETTKSYLVKLKQLNLFQFLNKILILNLQNHNLLLKSNELFIVLNLLIQMLKTFNYEQTVLIEFSSCFLTVPAIITQIQSIKMPPSLTATAAVVTEMPHSQHLIKMIKDCDLSCRIYAMFSNLDLINQFLSDKDFLQAISFLGNLCWLEKFDFESFQCNVDNFIIISNKIFDYCSNSLTCQQQQHQNNNNSGGGSGTLNRSVVTNTNNISETISWNPLFGYLKTKSSMNYSHGFNDLLEQLRFLWSHQFILLLFDSKNNKLNDYVTKVNFKMYIKQIFDKTLTKKTNILNSDESIVVYRICSFYRKILMLISEPKIEILSALSIEDEFLHGLWRFFSSLLQSGGGGSGGGGGLKDLLKLIEKDKCFLHPIFDLLFVLSSLILYLITIFDENEILTEQNILTQTDFKQLSNFLNYFLYELLVQNLIDLKQIEKNNFFNLFHQLLIEMYEKQSKRTNGNTPTTASGSGGVLGGVLGNSTNTTTTVDQLEDQWTIKEIKIKNFFNELDKNKLNYTIILDKIPHVIQLKYRIELLQGYISKDKLKIISDGSIVPINVRRTKIIEDGITHISNLPTNLLKRTIRVTFINELGLNEAGVDQDGVFKEFLLEVIKKILNPQFNLFRVTSDQQLYPSPCSYFIEDHLRMFEFVGKLIGKAIYEGHVIDAEFAPFFLRQIVGCHNSNYSFLDDLATLDKELYKNLKSIKHNDVNDLELTFTHSEYHLGKLVTSELVPTGSHVKVTNENKIRYIHLLAHFKLHKQIKDQINAFNRGFKQIIKQEWLNMFTLVEIQRLISGSTVDLNLDDLKANVQYWGGLHSNHRLIKWLWEILESDFNREERALFLKFVTSSAKPPLLGFASLSPPFTIRCLEIDEEDGTIYDASFKGFFKTILNIGGKDSFRLPTSSTCFNLLKLPNYCKKSTLREKLRYAIKSNCGFELA